MIIDYVFSFLLGLIVGSFLNCIIYRIHEGKSFLRGRSFCPHCKHSLSAKDLIPLFSFLSLRGKCRYCKKNISIQYPMVEFFTGLFFLLTTYLLEADFFVSGVFNLSFLYILFYWIIVSYFVFIFVYDFKWFLIPDRVTISATTLTIIWVFLETYLWGTVTEHELLLKFVSAFGVYLFFFCLHFFSKGRAMGFGDVKLVFFLSLLLGWPYVFPALFIAFVLGAIIGLGIVVFKKKTLKTEIPFGPFLVIGAYSSIFFGDEIINFYLNLL